MPNLRVQRLIYNNLAQRPGVNRFLDRLGEALNKYNIPYATGLTRNKAKLFAANTTAEISEAKKHLLMSEKNRALRAVETYEQRMLVLFNKVNKKLEKKGLKKTKRFTDVIIQEKAIKAALVAGLSPKKIVGLFEKIMEKCSLKSLPEIDIEFAFKALPAALEAKLSSQQIVDLFGKILEKCEHTALYAFDVLPATLENIKQILSPKKIADLLGKIVEKCGIKTSFAFEALPAALEAKLPSEQIVDLFEIIVKEARNYAGRTLKILPDALEKVKQILSPGEIVYLFGKMVDGLKELTSLLMLPLLDKWISENRI